MCISTSKSKPPTPGPCNCSVDSCDAADGSFSALGGKFYIALSPLANSTSSQQFSLNLHIDETKTTMDEESVLIYFGVFTGIGGLLVCAGCTLCIPCLVKGSIIQYKSKKAKRLLKKQQQELLETVI